MMAGWPGAQHPRAGGTVVQYPKGSALFINVGAYETRDST
jgi:hypothetical protein